ncbi:hypothetical protein [Rhodococcus sp. NPDC060176]|uniref:hypothetical protein n=1 Tax=Rhodococcus sp. NPDC060176 TaxID=3347062 RepID=UPI0036566995
MTAPDPGRNYVTVSVQLADGTIVEKRREILGIGNPRYIRTETLWSANKAIQEVVDMLTVNHPDQIVKFPYQAAGRAEGFRDA